MTLLDEAARFFREDDWVYISAEGSLVLPFEGEHGQFTCYAMTREDVDQFLFYAAVGENTPESRRATMAELLCRANYGLILGNFELDMDDGEVRYKASIDVEDVGLHQTTIRNMVYAACLTLDNYLPAIERVNHSDCTAREALALVEGDEE